MLDIIVGGISSVLSGGLTGLLGVGIQRFADFMNKRQDMAIMKLKFDQDLAMRKIDGEQMAQEWAQRTKVAQIEADATVAAAESAAFSKSFDMEPRMYSEKVKPNAFASIMLVLIDFVRGLIRPGLTVYLCVLTTLIYFQARDLLGDQTLTQAAALDLTAQVVSTVLYLTTTCVLWWFGVQNKQSRK